MGVMDGIKSKGPEGENAMRKRIPIPSQERLKELLSYNPQTGKLYWKPRKQPGFVNRLAGKEALAVPYRGYLHGRVDGEMLMAHRVIFKLAYNQEPEQIDHINHIRSDNRLANLREADTSINKQNSGKYRNNTSGAVGVVWDKVLKKWKAQIWTGGRKEGKMIYIGLFDTVEDAAIARKVADKRFGYHPNHGEGYARPESTNQ
jgi:hypothetical protein